MSLVARHLEASGIPTVILGSAIDIVQHCSVPRFAFSDFPLGNPCGRPYDKAMQRLIVAAAIDFLARATAPKAIIRAPFSWESDDWREKYMEVGPHNREELRRQGEARKVLRTRIREQASQRG